MRDAIVISPKVFRKAIRITVRLLLALGCGLAFTFLDPAIPPQMLPTPQAGNRRTKSVAESVLAADVLPPGQQDALPKLDPPPSTEAKALPNPPPEEVPVPTLFASNLMAKSVEEGVLTAIGPTSAQRKPSPRPAPPPRRPQEQVSPNVPQKLSTPPSNGQVMPNVAQPVVAASASITTQQEPVPQPLAPFLTPEQAPPKPPQVSYEAGQLTIVAQNSTLSDILSQVRARTGADIDLPASASGERIWVQLGPGPARKVLAALLGGTTLDYVIQASDSETDPDGIRSVLLSPRTSAPAVAARAITPAGRSLPPRLSDTERSRAILNRVPPEARAAEETVSPEPAASTDAPQATPLTPAATPQTPATQQTPGAPLAPAAPQTPATPPTPPTTDAVATSETPAPEADKPPVNNNNKGDMVQTLQNMYEQRKQMQLARTPSSPN